MTAALTKTHPNAKLPLLLANAWDGQIPNIEYYCVPMPDAPHLPLTGAGTAATMGIDEFEAMLLKSYEAQSGRYNTYVMGYADSDDPADRYELVGWEVLGGSKGANHTVVLYYTAVDAGAAVEKHM